MEPEEHDDASLSARAVAAALAAALGAIDPALGVLAAGALPFLDAGFERVRQRQRLSCGYTVHVAAEEAGLEPEELVERLIADPQRTLLLAGALETASQTAWKYKLRTLGWALSTGALTDDDAKVMEETGWTRILRTFEAPHLRILMHLTRDDTELPGHMVAARRSELQEVSGFTQLIGPALAGLERDSMIRTTDGSEFDSSYRARWSMTAGSGRTFYVQGELARPCLDRFYAAGIEQAPPK